MVSHSSLSFKGSEYLIDGKPLLEHLQKHEGVDPLNYTPSIGCQPNTLKRLLGENAPDLFSDMVALYVCGMCGGYDGSPIGVKVSVLEDSVIWSQMGYSSDVWEQDVYPFKKVFGFSFKKNNYLEFVRNAQVYEVQ